jgi:hypothetical protein
MEEREQHNSAERLQQMGAARLLENDGELEGRLASAFDRIVASRKGGETFTRLPGAWFDGEKRTAAILEDFARKRTGP